MRRADIIGSLITIVFGGFAVSQSALMDYWSPFGPGPGFVPLWASIIMVGGGVTLLIHSLIKRPGPASAPDPERTRRFLAVGAVAGITAAGAIAMSYLGFTLSMFLFMALLVGWIGKHKWYVTLSVSALTAVSFYVVFAVWLEVPLPKGIVGF